MYSEECFSFKSDEEAVSRQNSFLRNLYSHGLCAVFVVDRPFAEDFGSLVVGIISERNTCFVF